MMDNVVIGIVLGLVFLWIAFLVGGWYISRYIAKDRPYDGTYL